MMKIKRQYILVTGGAGYIGSHMVQVLLDQGYEPIVFDNLSTGNKKWLDNKVKFIQGDLLHITDIEKVFKKYSIKTVLHFAAAIVVSESTKHPLKYYDNNLSASINLLEVMRRFGVKQIVFSSTAAVYGGENKRCYAESSTTLPQNPYGRSKLMVEKILEDCARAYGLRYVIFRYFNVSGWDQKIISRSTNHREVTHLIPSIIKAVLGKRNFIVYGNDYDTRDGTGVRDYIGVQDLCQAHFKSIDLLNNGFEGGVINLGNGRGFSVLEILQAAEKVLGQSIKYKIGARRPNEAACSIATCFKAKKLLDWKPRVTIQEMIVSEWNVLKERYR